MTLASRNKFVIQKVLESDITEEDKIFFQLWNEKPLLSLKSDFLAIIEQLRKEQYQQILENLEEISEFKIQKNRIHFTSSRAIWEIYNQNLIASSGCCKTRDGLSSSLEQ